jgi:hypothetical protein
VVVAEKKIYCRNNNGNENITSSGAAILGITTIVVNNSAITYSTILEILLVVPAESLLWILDCFQQ